MTSTEQIVLWILAFAATHMGMASLRVRPRLVAALGEGAYLGIYTVVSFATFVPLVMAYLRGIHGGAMLWNLRSVPVVHAVALGVAWLSFTLALAALVQPSPASIGPRTTTRARGLTRITRHPLFMNIGIWGLAHCVVNGFVNDVLFFGGIFLVGLFGCMHQDARKRVTEKGVLDEFYAETSLVPFAAIATGRGKLVPGELPWIGIAVGGVASLALYHFHDAMFH
ncbi:MAG TPA: NnrU family protein [Candidatus Limnocylindrales bacterium]|nr:NnrU family protein [Candidatus Limnocylindrales bacterium]